MRRSSAISSNNAWERKVDTWFDGSDASTVEIISDRVNSWTDKHRGVVITKFDPADSIIYNEMTGGIAFTPPASLGGLVFPTGYGHGVKEVFVVLRRVSFQTNNYLFGSVEVSDSGVAAVGQSGIPGPFLIRGVPQVPNYYKNATTIQAEGLKSAISISWADMINPTLILGYRNTRTESAASGVYELIFFHSKLTLKERSELFKQMKIKYPEITNL